MRLQSSLETNYEQVSMPLILMNPPDPTPTACRQMMRLQQPPHPNKTHLHQYHWLINTKMKQHNTTQVKDFMAQTSAIAKELRVHLQVDDLDLQHKEISRNKCKSARFMFTF